MAYSVAISAMANITGEESAELSRVFGPTLVPIAAAYAVAHYQLPRAHRAADVHPDQRSRRSRLGSVRHRRYAIDWTIVSPATIAWVQTLAIAIGHVAGVAAAHDVAISRYDHRLAVGSQYPMLAVMILYTVLGLFLLLGAQAGRAARRESRGSGQRHLARVIRLVVRSQVLGQHAVIALVGLGSGVLLGLGISSCTKLSPSACFRVANRSPGTRASPVKRSRARGSLWRQRLRVRRR